MARYPTLEEYSKRGNYLDGVKRCDDLLKKNPNDVGLLIVKLQLLCATPASEEKWRAVLDKLAALSPAVQDLAALGAIEDAVISAQADLFPPPTSAGSTVAKLWDVASKSGTASSRLDILSVRFARAVADNRPLDAQQALIQLKAAQPRNRIVYMAHAAYTQLLSTSEEDLQARLAVMLAKKAITEKFDDEKDLDCRVAGQILAVQGKVADLEAIKDRPRLSESKQVYEALRPTLSENTTKVEVSDVDGKPDQSPKDQLVADVARLKKDFTKLLAENSSVDSLKKFTDTAAQKFHNAVTSLKLPQHRGTADLCFLAVSALVKLYTMTSEMNFLLQAAFLTDRLLKHNEHVHEARLILIYLYMRLGLGSLAIELFESLRIKEIQNDTVGHALYTRLALVHPGETAWGTRPATSGKCDPFQRTHTALAIYPRHDDALADTAANVLRHGQTGMLIDLHDLRAHLRTSVARRIACLEHRRIARLTARAPSKAARDDALSGPRVVANWTTTTDNRDFAATFNFGFAVEKALYADDGKEALPGTRWVLETLTADTVWSLATNQTPLILDPAALLAPTESPNTSSSPPAGSLPAAEAAAAEVSRRALALLLQVTDKADTEAVRSATADSLLAAVQALPVDALIADPASSSTSLAEDIPQHILYLDTLRIVLAVGKFLLQHPKKPNNTDAIKSIQEAARAGIQKLEKSARARSAGVASAKVKDRLLADEATRAAMVVVSGGGDGIVAFADKAAKAAVEGWGNVIKVAGLAA